MGFTVNMSQQEAESKAFEDLPAGKYNCKITDVSIEECGPNSKNPGKPYYHFEFTVQDGKYENQKIWTNAMLFEGALYTISNLLKALGEEVSAGQLEIPDADWFIGQDVVVKMALGKASKGADGTEYPARVEAKGFFAPGTPVTAGSGKAAAKKNSLLP